MRPEYTADAINALTKELRLLRKDIRKLSSETRTNTYTSSWVCKDCGHSLDWGAIICECGKTDPKLVRR